MKIKFNGFFSLATALLIGVITRSFADTSIFITLKDKNDSVVSQKTIRKTFANGKLTKLLDSSSMDSAVYIHEFEYQDTLVKKITTKLNGVFDSTGMITFTYSSDGEVLNQIQYKSNGDTDFVNSSFQTIQSGIITNIDRDVTGEVVKKKWPILDNCGNMIGFVIQENQISDTTITNTHQYTSGCSMTQTISWADYRNGQIGGLGVYENGKLASQTQYSNSDTTKAKVRKVVSFPNPNETTEVVFTLGDLGDTLDAKTTHMKVSPAGLPLSLTKKFRAGGIVSHESWMYDSNDSLIIYKFFGVDSVEKKDQRTIIVRDSDGRRTQSISHGVAGDTTSTTHYQYYP